MPPKTVKFAPEKPAREKQSHGLGITIFSAIILVIIVVTFIGAPVVSKVAEGNTANFGNYDGIPIEYIQGNTFSQQVEQLNRFYEQFNQGNNNVDLLRQMVWRQAFEQTTLQIGLKHEAEVSGIVVTDGAVDKQLINYESYQKDGKFSEELYRNTSAADRFKYRQDTRTQLLVRQYALDHTQGPLVSQATQSFVASMAYPQRKFSFVTFTDSDFPQNLVADFAAKNKGLFRSIDLGRITITSSEGDANKVRDEVIKGDKTFADLAKAYSKDAQAETGGALNVKRYFELKNDVTKAEDLDKLFSLAKGAVSPVITANKSWTIYKINAPAVDADLTNADILVLVRGYLAKNERGVIEDNLEAQAKAFIAEASAPKADFAALAKKIGKPAGTTEWVSLNFGNHELFPAITQASKDPTFQGLASNDEFFKKAFRLALGQVSAPILASPAVLVVKVDALKDAPVAGDTPVAVTAVSSTVNSERNKQLQQQILSSPKFKDQFQNEFNKLFATK